MGGVRPSTRSLYLRPPPRYDTVPGYVTRGRRRINGENWIQANRATKKPAAQAKAKAWRRQGRHARVIKVGKQWAVFVGGNNRRR